MYLSQITFIVLRIERQAKVPGCELCIIDGVPVLLVCESVSFTCLLAVRTALSQIAQTSFSLQSDDWPGEQEPRKLVGYMLNTKSNLPVLLSFSFLKLQCNLTLVPL